MDADSPGNVVFKYHHESGSPISLDNTLIDGEIPEIILIAPPMAPRPGRVLRSAPEETAEPLIPQGFALFNKWK